MMSTRQLTDSLQVYEEELRLERAVLAGEARKHSLHAAAVRKQQEEEYAAALAQDEERARAREQESARAHAAAEELLLLAREEEVAAVEVALQREALLSNLRLHVPDEPPSTSPDCVTLALQMPVGGVRIVRRFLQTHLLSHVIALVQVEAGKKSAGAEELEEQDALAWNALGEGAFILKRAVGGPLVVEGVSGGGCTLAECGVAGMEKLFVELL